MALSWVFKLIALGVLCDSTGQAWAVPENTSYLHLQQKSVHNAYQRKETIADMLSLHGIRSLEYDIHVDKLKEPRIPGDWYIYHSEKDRKTSLTSLSEGLAVLRKFHDQNPSHEVVTLWMDLKQSFVEPNHLPIHLDQMFQTQLGDALFTPRHLQERCTAAVTLQDTVRLPGCEWPDFASLRGRFMIILTESVNLDYIDKGQTVFLRQAFIAPVLGSADETSQHPYAIFFNLENGTVKNSDTALRILEKGLVTRTWGVNDRRTWAEVVSRGVHHIATDKVNASKDRWATTMQDDGSLFALIP